MTLRQTTQEEADHSPLSSSYPGDGYGSDYDEEEYANYGNSGLIPTEEILYQIILTYSPDAAAAASNYDETENPV